MKWFCIPILVSGLALAQAPAQPPAAALSPRERRIQVRFERADVDHDGKLTREEARNGMPRVFAQFDRIDHDHKGYVTFQDILTALRHAQ